MPTDVKWFAAALLVLSPAAFAHPMGNFSVNHYARFDVRPQAIELTYVLDLAELPTFELLSAWSLDPHDRDAIAGRATGQARTWLSALRIRSGGRGVVPVFRRASVQLLDGAGGLPVLRVTTTAAVPAVPGRIEYEDRNYPSRAGWKEIVVVHHAGVRVDAPVQNAVDRSHALAEYPSDPAVAPPQEIKASFRWSPVAVVAHATPPPAPSIVPARKPPQARAKAMGTVVRGDYLSRMLGGRRITFAMAFLGLCVAFGLGALHALSPGHGKTIVAAYLVGSRGTLRHAAFLGAIVTFTHTAAVFALGIGVLFFQRYFVPEKIIPILGAVSGLSIVAVGGMLLHRRIQALRHEQHHHHHGHSHPHTHSHDGHVHSHVPEGAITLPGLVALGVSGGLVPCPSALVLLLSSIALGRVGLGLVLLVAFSAGLAVVLMGIGAMVLYAKNLLPERSRLKLPALRYIPVGSAAVVMLLGLAMAGASLG